MEFFQYLHIARLRFSLFYSPISTASKNVCMWLTQWTFVLAETFLCVSLSWHTQCTTAIYRERSRSIFICIYGYTEAKKKKNNYDYLYFTDRVCVRFFPRLNLAGMERSKAGELLWNQIVYVLMCAWNHVADSSLKKIYFGLSCMCLFGVFIFRWKLI